VIELKNAFHDSVKRLFEFFVGWQG